MFKSGFISIAGKPNVGKSTLLNAFLGQKIAAVSPKPQTTRYQITGVVTKENSQFIFVDTPGIHNAKNKLGKYMNNEAFQGVDGADLVLYLVAADKCNIENEQEIIEKINCDNKILVINKTDAVPKETLLPLIASLQTIADFKEIVPVSALKNDGTNELLKVIEKYLPEGPKFFPDDTLTDQPEKQICAEFIREKLMRNTNCEIPYGIAVVIESMKFNEEKNLTSIEATIFCERDSHKSIIIGKNGEMLKKIGTSARRDFERFLGGKVYLNLWVKVKENWRNSEVSLKNFGYTENK
ncbi:MAG: GTPase Era [Clostridia bacterium]|nr:GTPase Era [Clostridia bacterium]